MRFCLASLLFSAFLATACAADDCLPLPDEAPCSKRVICRAFDAVRNAFRKRAEATRSVDWSESTAPVYSTDPNVRSFLPRPHRDYSGLKIAGVNTNAELMAAESLTGVSFRDLDLRAKSGGDGGHVLSAHFKKPQTDKERAWKAAWGQWGTPARLAGFLEEGQDLKQVLIADNSWVLGRGLSHQQIAEPILRGMHALESANRANKVDVLRGVLGKRGRFAKPVVFKFGGKRYRIAASPTAGTMYFDGPRSGWIRIGTQGSFFNDGLYSGYHYQITDLSKSRTISGDALTPHLIYRYGFYQGGKYRQEPKAIVVFFNLRPRN